MEDKRFDSMARAIASRRAVLRSLSGGPAASLAAAIGRGHAAGAPCGGAGRPCDEATPCCGRLLCADGTCVSPGSGTGAGCPVGQTRCGGQCVPVCPPGQIVDPTTCGCVCHNGGAVCGVDDEICCELGEGCEGDACCAGLHLICQDRRCCAGLSCEAGPGDEHLTCRGQPGFPCVTDDDCSVISSGPCCNGVCVSARDTANCGACGQTCDLTNPDERCVHGECCLDFGAACDPTGGPPCCGHDAPSPYQCGNDLGDPVCCGTPGALCDRAFPHQCCSGVCEDSGSTFTCA